VRIPFSVLFELGQDYLPSRSGTAAVVLSLLLPEPGSQLR
jgi:hypothetical protein